MFAGDAVNDAVHCATPSPSIAPRRVDELWFNDGTLVLATDISLFRIYGGLLAKASPIFHDMLQLPQPKAGETLEGCAVVQLPDNGRDVEYFLKALFDYQFFLPFPAPTKFDIITGIIRISRKYEVEALHKRALVHLASGYPFDATKYTSLSPSWDMAGQEFPSILFAREMALDWVLPTAFYRVCAGNSMSEISNGVAIDNVRMELHPKDKLLCLEQCVLLRGSASADIINFLWDPEQIQGCRDSQCKTKRIVRRKEAEIWRADHLPLSLWLDSDWHSFDVCATCVAAMKAAHQTLLNQFWEGLPGRFGLPSWEELSEMKENLLGN